MLWFPEHEGNKIGRLDPSTGEIREYVIPTPGSGPADVAIAADGAVWFTELDADKVGRLDPASGTIREFAIPAARTGQKQGPAILAHGPDGAIWFTHMYGNRIGRIDSKALTITAFRLPAAPARARDQSRPDADDDRAVATVGEGPAAIVRGPDDTLWYTASYGNKVGRYEARVP